MFELPMFLVFLVTCQCNTDFSKGARSFSIQLMHLTAEETQWHMAISPLGIWSILTAVSIGATGNSREQLIHTLNLPQEMSTVLEEYKNFIKSVILQETPNIQLKFNNFLFLDTSFTAEEEFEQSITNDFGARVTRMNFNIPADAADYANSIIRESDMSFSNVIQPKFFDQLTRLILTNTISFKGLWQFPFNDTETRVQDFHDEMGKVIGQVNMMQQEGLFQYSNLEMISAYVLELPYGETGQYSFLAILPYPNVTLADVLSGLESFSLKDILDQIKADTEKYDLENVVVSLPRFKITTNVVLNSPLMAMGLGDIFDSGKASFDLISKTEELYVSAIVHNADIEVTEAGTKAAAATSAIISNRIAPSNFNANRPFIYFIIEKFTATFIFSGIYSMPTIY